MPEYESNANRTADREDPKCRTCTDFKSWAKQQRMSMFSTKSQSTTGNKSSTDVEEDAQDVNRNCPLDKNALGRSTWGLLHTISVTFPEKPTVDQKQDMVNMMNSLGNLYPCEYCARDLKNELVKEPVDASSQQALAQWLCRLHNKVNVKIGKPVFDCTKVYERWRDGWLDGSCD